jgi:ATP-dependent exoDNAse (exonuclease V) alpha subunit
VDAFFYHASAFRLFLLRNRYISDYQKTFNRNLIKFLSALWRAGTSPAKLKRLMSAIEKEKNVADLKWLMEKVEIMMS